MPAPPSPPALPTDRLAADGWELTAETVETVFEQATLRVRAATQEYEDARRRVALREATDGRLDRPIRFFAGTGLAFEPPPPPGMSPTLVAPTLRSEARADFVERLEDRGLVDVDKDGRQRVRVGSGRRARLTKYTAADPLQGHDGSIPLACWIAIWTDSGAVNIVTGGHPAASLVECLDVSDDAAVLSTTAETYREEFTSLLRAVDA